MSFRSRMTSSPCGIPLSGSTICDHMHRAPLVLWTAVYAGLTVALTFPAALHLSTKVPHDLGDPLLSAAILWWNAHVMPLTARWWDGFAFYPASGFMAYSDHRLGESLLGTPLQWLGCNPVTAYNLTLLATFPLCALAAHWLAFTLTGRHDASALCGLAYGFSPYRTAHIEHLELLAAFGMPAALVALHRYVNGGRRAWLVVLALALVVQGLCTSYYLLFFAVFLALWMAWFLRWRDSRLLGAILLAGSAAATVLIPIALGYLRVHRHYEFARPYRDIITLSADVTSLVTSSNLSLFWRWTSALNEPERQLFPGLTIAVLALIGTLIGWRAHLTARDRLDRLSRWLMPLAIIFAVIAICGWALGPWRIAFAGVTVSSSTPFKPMSLAVYSSAVMIALSSRVRGAYTRRSVLGFYLLAAGVMFVCSFGPKPMLLHHQVLYEPPYAWLMRLPVFASVRVPARFAMPGVLALSVVGALAFDRLRLDPAKRRAIAAMLMAGIVADSWIDHLPLPSVPDVWAPHRASAFAAVLELPAGDVFDDMAAMYRVISHGRRVVNGNSGFEANHYQTLVTALNERDPSALDPITAAGPVFVVVHKALDQNRSWQRFLMTIPGVRQLGDDEHHLFFAAPPQPPPTPVCTGDRLSVAGVSDDRGTVSIGALIDGNPFTFWTTPGPPGVGDSVVIDLGRPARPCAVMVGIGLSRINYARKLSAAISLDGVAWSTVATERIAGHMVRALLETPRGGSIAIPFSPVPARFIRLRVEEASEKDAWIIAELSVIGARQQE